MVVNWAAFFWHIVCGHCCMQSFFFLFNKKLTDVNLLYLRRFNKFKPLSFLKSTWSYTWKPFFSVGQVLIWSIGNWLDGDSVVSEAVVCNCIIMGQNSFHDDWLKNFALLFWALLLICFSNLYIATPTCNLYFGAVLSTLFLCFLLFICFLLFSLTLCCPLPLTFIYIFWHVSFFTILLSYSFSSCFWHVLGGHSHSSSGSSETSLPTLARSLLLVDQLIDL